MSDLFGKLYNPDVLTCLANLSNDEVFTPPEVVNQMLDMLPAELFESTETTFLDPCTKSGVFLREIAKRLIEAQIPNYEEISSDINIRELSGEELTKDDLAFRKKLVAITEHVFKNQLFGIAITELTSLISRRSVYCTKSPHTEYAIVQFDDPKGNIEYEQMEHNWVRGKCSFCGVAESGYEREEGSESYAYQFIHLYEPEKVFNMKFDVVIGNPPYQMSDGGNKNSASPIYHKFVEQAMKLNPRFLVMITPSRWLSGGKGLDTFREKMLNDGRVRQMVDYINAKDCFPENSISGGVNYFVWQRDEPGDCLVTVVNGNDSDSMSRKLNEYEAYIRYNTAVDVVRKIKSKTSETLSNLVSSRNPFGFATSARGNDKQVKDDCLLISSDGDGYVKRDEIERGFDSIDKYKVMVSRIVYEHAGEPDKEGKLRVLSKIRMLNPGEVCTDSYLIVGAFDTEEEATNLVNYLASKFVRFLVAQSLSSINLSKEKFAFVPIVNFKEEQTDRALYEKFDLTEKEANLIENSMHPIEIGA